MLSPCCNFRVARLCSILLVTSVLFGAFSNVPRINFRSRSVRKSKWHYPWKAFKKVYFVDSYETCQFGATVKNSLYVYLKNILSASIPALKDIEFSRENACMRYAHNYSYNQHESKVKQDHEGPWLKASLNLASLLASSKSLFPEIPLEEGSNFLVNANLSASLTKLQQSKINSDTFFVRNFGQGWATRMNPLLQNMIHDHLCTTARDYKCPERIIEFGCGVAGNLRHFCGTHNCLRAICVEASTYAQFVNTVTLPSSFEMLIGDITHAKTYENLPSKAFDLVYQSWAFMYVPGVNFHVQTLLPALYNALVKGGYYAFEGPVGNINAKGMFAPTPSGRFKEASKSNSIENVEFFFDHCRLLVKSGHFKLIEDTRYQSGWSVVTDLTTVKPIIIKRYEDYNDTAWIENQHYDRGASWELAVSSDCLLQKLTDASLHVFRKDLMAMVPPL
jgi:hypothetical protein